MGFGCGKLILLGEHSVVYGKQALAASIDKGVSAEAHPSDAHRLRIDPWGVDIDPDSESSEPLGRAFHDVLKAYPERPGPRLIHVDVGLPPGAGLGCSAAISVAVVRSIDEAEGIVRDPSSVVELSMIWERVFHGNPSGVDSSMAAGRGVATFQKGSGAQGVPMRSPLWLVVAHTGRASSTKVMVDEVARQLREEPDRVQKVFEGIESLVRNGRLAVQAGDTFALGRLMDLNQGLLNSLLVSNGDIEDLCHRAREAGALGAKLTGAGGGGCVIALASEEAQAHSICEALRSYCEDCFVTCVGGREAHAPGAQKGGLA